MKYYDLCQKMEQEHKTFFDMPLRVTFYARVSTKKEEQLNSKENQIETFTKLIQDNPNWDFVEGYVDTIRGESIVNRDNFLRMIEDAKNGKFDLIIAKEISRFSRDMLDSIKVTRELLSYDVGAYFMSDSVCTFDKDSELRLGIMASIYQQEVARLSSRIKFGHSQAIKNGVVLGNNRIFGYTKKDKKLYIDEKEAKMVRLIFNLYATGNYSVRKIENELYNKGYRGRNGTRIHHNTVSGIIQNPKYKGYYCGNKVKITDYRTKEQKFLPESEWIMYKDETGNIVPAIVSEDLWDKCNEIFKKRSTIVKEKGRSLKDQSVFTGKIWCSAHDVPYWRTSYSNSVSKGSPIYQWICSEKRKNGSKACLSISIQETELYSMIGNYFSNISDDIQDYINTFMEIYKSTDNKQEINTKIISLETEKQKAINKKDKILELYMDGIIGKSEFADRNNSLNEAIESIESEIQDLEKSQNNSEEYFNNLKSIEKYFLEMFDKNTLMTKIQIDEMVKVLLDRIEVIPIDKKSMKLTIVLNIGEKHNLQYVRNGTRYGCRSGNTFKKMCPEQQMKYYRNNRTHNQHTDEIVYYVDLAVNL